jgi:hypothetical protein
VKGGGASSLDDDDINGKACPLFAVEVTPDGEVLNDVVLLVEGIEETSTFQGVVPFRTQVVVVSELATQNQDGTTAILQGC